MHGETLKYPNIKFHKNPSTASRAVPLRMDGRTDRNDKAMGGFFAIMRTPPKNGAKYPNNIAFRLGDTSV